MARIDIRTLGHLIGWACRRTAEVIVAFALVSLILNFINGVAIAAPQSEQDTKLNASLDQFYNSIWSKPSYEGARAAGEAMVELGKSRNDKDIQARGLIRLVFVELIFGKWRNKWVEKLEECEKLISSETKLAEVEYLIYHGYMLGKWREDLEGGDKLLAQAIEKADALENDLLLAQALLYASEIRSYMKDRYKACLLVARARRVASDTDVQWCKLATLDLYIQFHLGRASLSSIRPEIYRLQEAWPHSRSAQLALFELGENPSLVKSLKDRIAAFEATSKPNQSSPSAREKAAWAYWTLGRTYYVLGKIDESRPLIQSAIRHYKILDNQSTLDRLETVLELIDLNSKSMSLEEVVALANRVDDKKHRKLRAEEALIVSSKFRDIGSDDLALAWQRKALRLAVENSGISWMHIAASADAARDKELQARDQRKYQAEQLEKQKIQARVNYTLAFLGVALCLGIGIVVFRKNAIERQNADLERLVRERTGSYLVAMEKAQSADKAKGEFLARINHEIRNPLTAILGFIEFIESKLRKPDDELKDCLAGLTESSRHLHDLVNGILEVSQIEEGVVELEQREFHFVETLNSTFAILQGIAQEKGLKLDCSVTGHGSTDFRLLGDEAKLKQIILNVTSNAIKFTDVGNVRVLVECVPVPQQDTVSLVIEVVDTGRGIPDADLDRVFEKFTFSSNNQHVDGSGLGLYISKLLTERMDGEISLSSELGVGTSVTVRLPFEKTYVERHANESKTETETSMSRKVLVVDDQQLVAKSICLCLEHAGYLTRSLNDSRETMTSIEEWQPDIVLLDLRMPHQSGFEVIELIHQSGCSPMTIAITGDATAEVRERCMDAGFDACLVKPFSLANLNAAVDGLFEDQSAISRRDNRRSVVRRANVNDR